MTEKSSPSKSADTGEFRKWLWDSDRKAFLGRTGTNWVQLLVFYAVFYTLLAAFWTLALVIFMQTIDFKEPKWQGDSSRIGDNPGLGYRPRASKDVFETSLIWFKSGQSGGNYQHYVDDLDNFIQPYKQDTGDAIGRGETVASSAECKNPGYQPPKGKFCPFNYKDLITEGEKCTSANRFGYDLGQPCVLIKINKIYGWRPTPYQKFPDRMKNYTATAGQGVVITCDGENAADKEAIGSLRYTPSQTIPANHFPFTNQQGYQSPFVMVQFTNPSRGKVINIECKAWAENISYKRKEAEGSIHFELMIE